MKADTAIKMVGNVSIGLRTRNGMVTFQVNDETPLAMTVSEAQAFSVALNDTIMAAIVSKAETAKEGSE